MPNENAALEQQFPRDVPIMSHRHFAPTGHPRLTLEEFMAELKRGGILIFNGTLADIAKWRLHYLLHKNAYPGTE